MASIAPPRLPVALSDEGGLNRLYHRLWLLTLSFLTVVATAWFVMLGPISAIIALTFAKHILVALLVMALGVDESRQADA
jgi:hypothetical protein